MKKSKLRFFDKLKNRKFPALLSFFMIVVAVIFVFVFIFSSKVTLTLIAAFISIEVVFLISGIYILIKRKYDKVMSEEIEYIESDVVLPKMYQNMVTSINQTEKSNDLLYFEISILPILKNLISDRFRSIYRKNVHSLNYEQILDKELIKIINEKHPYQDEIFGYDNKSVDIKKEVINILKKIEEM